MDPMGKVSRRSFPSVLWFWCWRCSRLAASHISPCYGLIMVPQTTSVLSLNTLIHWGVYWQSSHVYYSRSHCCSSPLCRRSYYAHTLTFTADGLEMLGSRFDFFDPASWGLNRRVGKGCCCCDDSNGARKKNIFVWKINGLFTTQHVSTEEVDSGKYCCWGVKLEKIHFCEITLKTQLTSNFILKIIKKLAKICDMKFKTEDYVVNCEHS